MPPEWEVLKIEGNTMRAMKLKCISKRNVLKLFAALALAAVLFAQGCVSRPPVAETPKPFTIAVLPDTQIYAWKFPDTFHAQTQWIADQCTTQDIRYVLHLGDIVHNNNDTEWKVASSAMARVEAKVPCAYAVGNHDMGVKGKADTRDSLYDKYFPRSRFKEMGCLAGVYDKEPDSTVNSYHTFSAGGHDWLVLSLEFGPRHDVVRWANEVVAAHQDRWVILLTHAYLDRDGRRYNRAFQKQSAPPYNYGVAKTDAGLNDAEDLWQKLVGKYPNFKMVICGHMGIAAHKESKGEAGNTVHEMSVDYQSLKEGGQGWLRLMTFDPVTQTVAIRDYSPLLNEWAEEPNRKFDIGWE